MDIAQHAIPSVMPSEYIIELLRKGDKRAFQLIYDEFYMHLKHTAYRIVQDIYEAEDVAITTIESIFEKPREFDSYEKLKAYLFVTLKNKCLKCLERETAHRKSHNEIAFLLENDYSDYAEAQIVRAEFLSFIYNEIKKLKPARRRIFEMIYIHGLTAPEVAAELNIKIEYVYVSVYKSLKELRIVFVDYMK